MTLHGGRPDRAITWSYGGGTQSVAIAVLVSQGKLPRPERIVISDTSREASETWEYTDRWVRPMLRAVGCEIETAPHSLATVDLYAHNGDLEIPAYTLSGSLPGFCSGEWKRDVVARWLRAAGYGPGAPVATWIGISLDEIGRAKPGRKEWQQLTWPLLDYSPPLRRRDCVQIVETAGLPTPPKSSCWMCPYRRNSQWRRLRDHYPQDWERACTLDEEVRAKDKQGGVWLHESRVPLREADLSEPDPGMGYLFGEVTGCDSGMCWV